MSKRKGSTPKRKGFDVSRVTPAAARKYKKALAAADREVRIRQTLRAREAAKKKHAEASRKGWRTRAAKKNAASVLRTMLRFKAEGAAEEDWSGVRQDWHAVKQELYDALDEDFDRYADMLEDIADECDTDWAIAYGPGGEQ